MHFDENQYEDELDRMRARKARRGSGRVTPPQPVDTEEDDFEVYENVEDVEADSLELAWDEEENPHVSKPRKSDSKSQRKTAKNSHQTTKSGKRRRKKRGIWKFLLILVALLCAYLLFQRIQDDGYWTIAIFGVDSRDGNLEKGALADVDMVCSINKKTGEMRLVSVFRDSYMRIDDNDTYHKINEAYFKGGHKQAVAALEQNLDLKIDDYATFNWKAVVDGINVLGRIDLEITDKEFAYINAFITETVNSTGVGSYQLEQSGMNHLDGVQAVAYARLRLMDTDFNRTERQRKVLGLAMDKAKSASYGTLKTLVGTVFPQVSTSIGVDNILGMAKNARKYYIGETSGFPFSHTEMKIGKMDCVIPTTLESNVVQLHEFLYDNNNYKPSAMVKNISNYISEKTGLGAVGKDVESDRTNGSSEGGKKPSTTTKSAPPESIPSVTESAAESPESSVPESESVEETTIAPLESTQEQSTEANTSEAATKPATTTPVETAPESPRETTGALEGPGQGAGNDTVDAVGPGV